MRCPRRLRPLGMVLLLSAACTYGPETERVDIGQIVRVGDSDRALVVIPYERSRPATGLSAFPDGGRARVLERRASLYLVDASARQASLLTQQSAPDSLWESFSLSVRGLEGDSVSYVAVTGCPKGGECHPPLLKTRVSRVSLAGSVVDVPDMPTDVGLPGVMLARREGEEQYVRFSSEGRLITARFEEDGDFEALWEVSDDGSLAVAPTRPPDPR